MMEEADLDGDQTIDFEEFVAMMAKEQIRELHEIVEVWKLLIVVLLPPPPRVSCEGGVAGVCVCVCVV